MTEVQKLISANGVQPVWLDDIGQNYVEYQNGGVNYKIWIEDATSLEKKLTVRTPMVLPGSSFWKLDGKIPLSGIPLSNISISV